MESPEFCVAAAVARISRASVVRRSHAGEKSQEDCDYRWVGLYGIMMLATSGFVWFCVNVVYPKSSDPLFIIFTFNIVAIWGYTMINPIQKSPSGSTLLLTVYCLLAKCLFVLTLRNLCSMVCSYCLRKSLHGSVTILRLKSSVVGREIFLQKYPPVSSNVAGTSALNGGL